MVNDSGYFQKSKMIGLRYASIRQFVGYKTLLALSAFLVFVFPDTAILAINNVIQLKINILGFLLERLLQSIFDIPLRQAQVLAAWIYLIIGVFIVWYVFKKFYQVLFDVFYSLQQIWIAKNRFQKFVIYALIMLLIVAFTKITLLFV
jgi:hypothetical protein